MLNQFKLFDKNNDGILSKEEILEGYKKIFGNSLDEKEIVINFNFKKNIFKNKKFY